MAKARAVPLPSSRLLTAAQSAAYFGMSVATFKSRCNVPPMDLGDQRLELWDRNDLDEWVETRKKPVPGVRSVADALAEFKRENRRSREAP